MKMSGGQNNKVKGISNQYDEMRKRVPKAKKEYASLKEVYDKELAEDQKKLNVLKQERDAFANGIGETVMERYNAIKFNRPDPLAQVANGQCSGCNMEIAATYQRRLKDKENIVECENCGRMLYLP